MKLLHRFGLWGVLQVATMWLKYLNRSPVLRQSIPLPSFGDMSEQGNHGPVPAGDPGPVLDVPASRHCYLQHLLHYGPGLPILLGR